jgi:hypothetical protein
LTGTEAFWRVVRGLPDRGQAQDGELAGRERAPELLELADADRAVGDARVDAEPIAERAGEVAASSRAAARTFVSDGEPDSRATGERGVLEVRRFPTGDARAVHALDDTAMSAAGVRGRSDEDLDSVAAGYVEDGGDSSLASWMGA